METFGAINYLSLSLSLPISLSPTNTQSLTLSVSLISLFLFFYFSLYLLYLSYFSLSLIFLSFSYSYFFLSLLSLSIFNHTHCLLKLQRLIASDGTAEIKYKKYLSASAHGAIVRRIDPSWWTHSAIYRSNQCSTTGVRKAMV